MNGSQRTPHFKTALAGLMMTLTASCGLKSSFIYYGAGAETLPSSPSNVGKIEQIDVASDGTPGNGNVIYRASISEDGRYIAFASSSSNLVANDSNGAADIFVRDLQDQTTVRVSVSSSGVEGNGESSKPMLSGNGRYLVFESVATNLVAGDTNGRRDVFRHDLQTSQTELVSTTTGLGDANHESLGPSISYDGNLISFVSRASNLASIPDTAGSHDVFIKNMTTNALTLVTEARDSTGARTGTIGSGATSLTVMSRDGRYVAFHSGSSSIDTRDTNASRDVFQYDFLMDRIQLATLNASNVQSDTDSWTPSISADGQYVTYHSATSVFSPTATAYGKIYRMDMLTRAITVSSLTETNSMSSLAGCSESNISSTGNLVAFHCNASDMVANDTNAKIDVFIRNHATGTTTRVSLNSNGDQLNGDSSMATLSFDETYALFLSKATNIPSSSTDDLDHLYQKILKD